MHLLACTIHLDEYEDWGQTCVNVWLIGPRRTFDLTSDESYQTQQTRSAVRKAFEVFMPAEVSLRGVRAKMELSPVDPNWRTEMAELLRGRRIDNQGTAFDQSIPVKEWMSRDRSGVAGVRRP